MSFCQKVIDHVPLSYHEGYVACDFWCGLVVALTISSGLPSAAVRYSTILPDTPGLPSSRVNTKDLLLSLIRLGP